MTGKTDGGDELAEKGMFWLFHHWLFTTIEYGLSRGDQVIET